MNRPRFNEISVCDVALADILNVFTEGHVHILLNMAATQDLVLTPRRSPRFVASRRAVSSVTTPVKDSLQKHNTKGCSNQSQL